MQMCKHLESCYINSNLYRYVQYSTVLWSPKIQKYCKDLVKQWNKLNVNCGLSVCIRAFRFVIWIDSFWANQFESIRFVKKKSAIRFGRCIRLINDHTPWHSPILRRCISHSAVQLILLTLHNIYWSCESDSWWRSRVDIWPHSKW